ncbi:MAG: hypothetical protein K2M99_05195 [Treponemataceae bacterium]|nr:hypothetical protein [Treponemataceae bacterium]
MKKLLLGAITALAFGLVGCYDGRNGIHDAVVKPLSIEGAVSGVMEGGESGTRAQLTMLTGETDFENALQEYAFTYSSDKMTGWGASEGTIIFKIMATSTPGIWSDDWGAPKDETITLTVQEELSASELEGKDPVDVYDFTKLYQRGTPEASDNPGNIVINDLADGENYKLLVRYYPLTDEASIAIVGTVINFPSLSVQTDDGNSYEMTRLGSTYQYVFDKETAAGTRKFIISSQGNPSVYWSTESVVSGNEEEASAKVSQPSYMTFSYEAGKQYFVSVVYDVETSKAKISAGEYDTSILGVADIIGGFDGWKGSKLTRVNDTTYIFDFTNDATEIGFDIREKAGTWDVGRWFKGIPADTADRDKTDVCDDIIAAKKGATPVAVTPIYYKGDSGNDGQDLKITGLPYKGHKFRLTATIVDADNKKLSLTVQALDDIPEADYVKPDSLYKADGISYICSNYGNYEIAWGEKKADGSYEGTVTIPAETANTWGGANTADISFGVTNNTDWGVKYVDGVLSLSIRLLN